MTVADLFTDHFEIDPVISEDVAEAMASVAPFDEASLDRIFPQRYRMLSQTQWTSVRAARVIAELLKPYQKSHRKLFDVGSGVGRFCFVMNYLTDFEIHGVEQRRHLHDVARVIATRNEMKRVHLKCANMTEIEWSDFDIIYMYNPFQEHTAEAGILRIDNRVPHSVALFSEYTAEAYRRLCTAPAGQLLVTFHGYGGEIPSSWKRLETRKMEDGTLNLWIKEDR